MLMKRAEKKKSSECQEVAKMKAVVESARIAKYERIIKEGRGDQ